MKIIIYLKIEGRKALYKFHEIDVTDGEYMKMRLSNLKGFDIQNPLYDCLLTPPNVNSNGVSWHKTDVIEWVDLPYADEIMAVCKLV